MKVCTLASSSKGNCTVVFTETTKILIDAGVSIRKINQRLDLLGLNCNDIDAVIVTHEHSDHVCAVGNLIKKFSVPVYVHTNSYAALVKKFAPIDTTKIVQFLDDDFIIGDLKISPFPLPHDAIHCVGFNISVGTRKVTIATDLGYVPSSLVKNFEGSTLVILESNHDVQMLMSNPKYSFSLKNRILGKRGHLSNELSARVVEKLAHMKVKQVVLAHLSEENNTPQTCYTAMQTHLSSVGIEIGKHIKIDIAKPDDIGTLYSLK